MRLRELAARQRRDGAVVLAVDGVLALAEAARGEAHRAAGRSGSPKFTLVYHVDVPRTLSLSALSKAVGLRT